MVFCVGGGELASLDAEQELKLFFITYATGRH